MWSAHVHVYLYACVNKDADGNVHGDVDVCRSVCTERDADAHTQPQTARRTDRGV